MTTDENWDLFIAHAGRDAKRATAFYEHVSPFCRAFLDSACLQPGESWDVSISKAQYGARATVALISANIHSAYYAREEIATGIALERRDNQAHRVVPVYLDGMPQDVTQVPYGLRLKNGVDIEQIGGLKAAANKVLSIVNAMRRTGFGETPEHHSHILHQFPRGPMVPSHVIRQSLIEAYADLIKPAEAASVIAEASALRREADPDDETVTVIQASRLPYPPHVGTYVYFQDAFVEAGLHGPRMLASLINVVPSEQFSRKAQEARANLLTELQNWS